MRDINFLDYFSGLEDPRSHINKLYTIDELLLLTLFAVICGADGWEDIEYYGECKLEFLREFLPYQNGIPSDDTLRRFFRAMDTNVFRSAFIQWASDLNIALEDKVIAIDGKTSRHSFDHDKKALHTVSAFISEARMVLGQVKTDEKSNEITAIPELLDLLDIKGGIVTIDAMGCQKEIAEKILAKEANYILALKGNQGTLHEDITLFFEDKNLQKNTVYHEDTDAGHGRIETRKCSVTENINWLTENHHWHGLKSIIRIESSVEQKGKITEETRYYISSLPADAAKINAAIRSHWAIENSLHWVLDMSFGDDQSRIRKGNAPENITIIKHLALNLLSKAKEKRQSMKRLRKTAGWDDNILKNIVRYKV